MDSAKEDQSALKEAERSILDAQLEKFVSVMDKVKEAKLAIRKAQESREHALDRCLGILVLIAEELWNKYLLKPALVGELREQVERATDCHRSAMGATRRLEAAEAADMQEWDRYAEAQKAELGEQGEEQGEPV